MQWRSMHTGTFLTTHGCPRARRDRGHPAPRHPRVRAGPGQPSSTFAAQRRSAVVALHLLVLTAQAIGREASPADSPPRHRRLRPAVFLCSRSRNPRQPSPHTRARAGGAGTHGRRPCAQAVVATHSPSLMRGRADPSPLPPVGADRRSRVATVAIAGRDGRGAQVRSRAPARLSGAVLRPGCGARRGGQRRGGASRCLQAAALEVDAASVSVVPLGGRHVNHFWRLLHGLDIPHVTLLDLDSAVPGRLGTASSTPLINCCANVARTQLRSP
jgi:putative ATP-dependent endonuclease of OLD family